MIINDIIRKKRDGDALNDDEIAFFIKGVTKDEFPDYQVSALLMAIFLNGMNTHETAVLTDKMAHSGDVLDLSAIKGPTVDKHSTGGVGDKTTLIVGPIAASLGVKVAKLSGRGLGHTGGTVDKLESIKGFNTSIDKERFVAQVNDIGICVAGQTGVLAPADKKLYALRDVTCTVESIPLIASSIMSKKLAASAQSIVLDVKYGSGAFMKSRKEAAKLARAMVDIGKHCSRNMRALVTDMDVPLGHAVGNALEVREAVEVLKGGGPDDLKTVCLELAANMYSLSSNIDLKKSRAMCEEALSSGKAFEVFRKMVQYQGGDLSVIDDTSLLPLSDTALYVCSPCDGFITKMNCETVGHAAMLSGAGRMKKDDPIDPAAGIYFYKKTGDYVKKGERIADVYGSTEKLKEAAGCLEGAFIYDEKMPTALPLISDVIE